MLPVNVKIKQVLRSYENVMWAEIINKNYFDYIRESIIRGASCLCQCSECSRRLGIFLFRQND